MDGSTKLLGAALIAAVTYGCRVGSRDADIADATAAGDGVVGTYFAADSGRNLGKDWCYSGALVLDSTKHFGSVIKMCSDDGSGPVTETLKGTYHFHTRSVKVSGVGRIRRLYVVLDADGAHRRSHTLRYDNGTLRFDEPWWMGAGLRALEIPDPVLKKISTVTAADSGPVTASSTPRPALAPTVLKAAPKKAAVTKPATK
jgi:hypothetical protein